MSITAFSEMNSPIISIVIANYNYGRFLDEAIQSIVSQDMGDKVELIICDAASTDNSVEVIEKYANGLPPNTQYSEWCSLKSNTVRPNCQLISWWCTEKDGGQSDAFNKGFSHARGRYLTWLNADDWFAPNALKTVVRYLEKYPQSEWFAGGGCRVSANGLIMKFNQTRKFQKVRAEAGELQTCGPSSFFARSLYERVGGYVDSDFHIAMDIELWERFYHIGGVSYIRIPGYLWLFRVHEASKTAHEDAGVQTKHDDSNPAWVKCCEEHRIIKKRYCVAPLTWWRRVLSISPVEKLISMLDTMRFKGKRYELFFPNSNRRRGVY